MHTLLRCIISLLVVGCGEGQTATESLTISLTLTETSTMTQTLEETNTITDSRTLNIRSATTTATLATTAPNVTTAAPTETPTASPTMAPLMMPAIPVFDPLTSETLVFGNLITIWSSSLMAVIYYTLDDRDPVVGSPFTFKYDTPILVNSSVLQPNGTLLISVFAVDTSLPVGNQQSIIVRGSYNVTPAPVQPDIVGVSQKFFTVVTINGTANVDLRYTQDGSTPTASSLLYTAPFMLPTGTYVVKAIAIDMTSLAVSDITTKTFEVIPPLVPPTFNIQNTEQVNTTAELIISSSDMGVLYYYVMCDTSTCPIPLSIDAANSTQEYSSATPIKLSTEGNYTVNAISWMTSTGPAQSRNSDVSTVMFSVKDVIAPPQVSPLGGDYLAPLVLSFTPKHTQVGIDKVTYTLNSTASTNAFPSLITVNKVGEFSLSYSVEGSEVLTEVYKIFPEPLTITALTKAGSTVTEQSVKDTIAVAVGTTPDNVVVRSFRPSSDPKVTIVEFLFNSTDSEKLTNRALSPTSALHQDFNPIYLTSVEQTPSPSSDDFPYIWVIIGAAVLCLLIFIAWCLCSDKDSVSQSAHAEELNELSRAPTPTEKADPPIPVVSQPVEREASEVGFQERAATPPVMPPVTTVTGSYYPPQQSYQQATFDTMEDPDSPTLLRASPHRPRDDWAPPCVAVRPLHEFCVCIYLFGSEVSGMLILKILIKKEQQILSTVQ